MHLPTFIRLRIVYTGMGQTTIRIDDSTADELHDRKERGDSYDDVITRMLQQEDE